MPVSQSDGDALEVKADDGRVLTLSVSGAEDGWPIFLLHGTPGSRIGPKPRSGALYRRGIRLICYDRPGYGGSTPCPGRRVADAAADVAAIAAALGITAFSVVGRSGGGPHALACAALLPDRVHRAAALVSLAPVVPDLDWFDGMAAANVEEYRAVDVNRTALAARIGAKAYRTLRDPLSLLDSLEPDMTESDRTVLIDWDFRTLLADTYGEGLRAGPNGWIDDVVAFRGEWGFDVADIATPVLLWHGVDDNFAPASHTRWLGSRIPNVEIRLQARTAHFGAVEILPNVLTWLAATNERPCGEDPAARPDEARTAVGQSSDAAVGVPEVRPLLDDRDRYAQPVGQPAH
jgi:pimeloyl-ACP methyl ester carboxylesterase